MDGTFVAVYENKAKQIFYAAFNRLPSATELERMVKMLKRGGGFFVGQALDKEEILDTTTTLKPIKEEPVKTEE